MRQFATIINRVMYNIYNMKTIIKIISGVIVGLTFLYSLVQTSVISTELAVTIGIIVTVFMFSFEELRKETYPVRNAICEIQRYLAKKWKFVPIHEIQPIGYVQAFSPVRLTTIGIELLENSGAKKIVEENLGEWFDLIDRGNYRTAYDVQSRASEIVAEKEDDPSMVPIKDYAYKNPRLNSKPLELSDIQRVMVVYLRDLYLQKHPEIPND